MQENLLSRGYARGPNDTWAHNRSLHKCQVNLEFELFSEK